MPEDVDGGRDRDPARHEPHGSLPLNRAAQTLPSRDWRGEVTLADTNNDQLS